MIRRLLNRLLGRHAAPAVTGPMRIHVTRTPGGVLLDLEHYLEFVITTLADEFLDELTEIAQDRASAGEYDGHAPEELLVERLAAAVGYEIPVYGQAVDRLADQLRAAAPVVSIPQQRTERGAAA